MQKEVEYLGYLLTNDCVKPQPKKAETINRLEAPKNTRQLKNFLCMVNFYRDWWPRHSHILAPLHKLSSVKGKNNWKWGQAESKAFLEAKRMLSKESLLSFPDFNKQFHLYSDASDRQLGATVVQDKNC